MLNYQRIIYRRYMEVPSWLVTYRSRQVPFLLSKAWLTGASHYINDPPVLSNNRNGKVPSYRSAWWYTYPSENMKVRLDHHPNYWGKYQVFQSPPTSIFGLRPPCVGDLLTMLDGTGGYPQWFFSGSSSMGIWVLEGIAYLQYSMNIPVIFHSYSIHIPLMVKLYPVNTIHWWIFMVCSGPLRSFGHSQHLSQRGLIDTVTAASWINTLRYRICCIAVENEWKWHIYRSLIFLNGFFKWIVAPKRIRKTPKSSLVGGIPTPLKNMSSSVGMMKFPIYRKIIRFQTTNQILFI